MRVLTVGSMYPPHHLGGYELMWESFVEELRRRGHDVRILASDFERPGAPGDESSVARSLRWYWRDHRFPKLSVLEALRLERGNLVTLNREIERFDPDVVSVWAMGGMSMSLVETLLRGRVPVTGVVHEDWTVYGPRVDQWQRIFGRPGLSRVAELVTGVPTRLSLDSRATWVFNSEATRDAASAVWPVADSEVVTPGVDLDLFAPAPQRPWRSKLLVLGRIDPRKGIALAIEALTSLPGYELSIVGEGDGAHLEELRQSAATLGVADRVEFGVLSRDEVPAAIAAANAVLFPVQWEEPWGLVPLEAMAVGRPVVASGRGGSGEFLRTGENSLVYAPHDSATALAHAVQKLAEDEELRERLGEGGQATAAARGLGRFAERMADIHEDLAATD